MTIFKDSHHFGSLWWQSFKTAITSAVFHDNLSRQPSLRQSSLTVFLRQSLKRVITSAVFDDNLQRHPSLRRSFITMFDDSAFLQRTLHGRFREKQVTTSQPWNSWRLAHSKNSVWASQWLVTLCTFYTIGKFFLWLIVFSLKLPPPACPVLLVWKLEYQNFS